MAPTIVVGDTIPQGEFKYIPYTSDQEDPIRRGIYITLIAVTLSTNEFAGKKVVLVSVPGAFTPTCHKTHLPQFLEKYEEFKSKGVDIIAVVAANDAFVMSGWGRVEQLKDKILTLSDTNAEFSAKIGLSTDLSHVGFGLRTARYALVLDNLVVTYIGVVINTGGQVEPDRGVTVSSAESVLASL
ncbi:Redoxin-domain-containing protein [Scleroderma yunnanense]